MDTYSQLKLLFPDNSSVCQADKKLASIAIYTFMSNSYVAPVYTENIHGIFPQDYWVVTRQGTS